MEINYDTFVRSLQEENYEDAFHILFRMIDNLDTDALRADREWTETTRNNSDNKTIKKIELEFKKLPREKKKEIESKYEQLVTMEEESNNANRNT